METLKLILNTYCAGEISLKEMHERVNKTMQFVSYIMQNGERKLTAKLNGSIITIKQ